MSSSRLVELRLQFHDRPCRTANAWLIPGTDAAIWLDEIALWQVRSDQLQLAIVSASTSPDAANQTTKPAVLGVLVWSNADLKPQSTRLALPYGCMASRLFLPVEAGCVPDISEQEIRIRLPDELSCLVWHPTAGLIGFEADDCLTVAALLSTGQPRESSWTHASSGVLYPQRLRSLKAALNPLDFLKDAGDDIGTEPDMIKDLPPSDTQPGPMKKAFGDFREKIAKSISKVTGQSDSNQPADEVAQQSSADHFSGGSMSWLEKLNHWAARIMSESVQRRRDEELNRLMDLLDEEPDQGLRKALPFNDESNFRGLAQAGDSLRDRDVAYNSGGTGPADAWKVSYEMQVRLTARYRELANRELRLKRHSRAAYIFAELLGDYASAAKVLEAGGYYPEAAAVYQDRLNQPSEAARCYERGGLFHQAIELFEATEAFEEAATVYEKIGRHDEAREFWTKAIHQKRAQQQFVHAAQLAQRKLTDDEQSLGLLWEGWESRCDESQLCLEQWIETCSSLVRHAEVSDQITALRKVSKDSRRASEVAQVLSKVVHQYPSDEINRLAKDVTRVIASEQLSQTTLPRGSQAWLNILRDLEPADQLLKRDCDRFHDQLTDSQQVHCLAIGANKTERDLSLLVKWDVPEDERIIKSVVSQQAIHLLTASTFEDRISLWQLSGSNQVSWKGGDATLKRHRIGSWGFTPGELAIDDRVILAPHPRDQRAPIVHILGEQPLKMPQTVVGKPYTSSNDHAVCLDVETMGIAQDRHGVIWHLASTHNGDKLETIGARGAPLHSYPIAVCNKLFHAPKCSVEHGNVFIHHDGTVSMFPIFRKRALKLSRSFQRAVSTPHLL